MCPDKSFRTMIGRQAPERQSTGLVTWWPSASAGPHPSEGPTIVSGL